MFICLALDGKHPSWANLVQKIKTVCLICLVQTVWFLDQFQYAEFDGGVQIFSFGLEYPFWENVIQKSKIV